MKLFEIRKSKIHGLGLFATRDIPWGTYIGTYTGQKITKKESTRREKFYNSIGVTYLFELNTTHDIDGLIDGNEMRFINHSEKANVTSIRRNGKIEYWSYDNIKKGEELLFDYGYKV